MPSIEETRCAKIAGFVAEGLKGDELEIAVRQWEDDRRITRPEARPKKARTQKPRAVSSRESSGTFSSIFPSSSTESHPQSIASNVSTLTHTHVLQTPTIDDNNQTTANNPSDENSATLTLQTVPLTHMFKRRPSLPVSEKRSSTLSDRSDESSIEDVAQSSSETRRVWDTVSLEKPPKGAHSDQSIRDGPLPMPSSSSSTAFDTPHLAWQGGNQLRTEDQTSPSWWHGRSTPSRSEFNFSRKDREGGGSMEFVMENMGYEPHGGENHYNRSLMEVCDFYYLIAHNLFILLS